MENKYLEPVLEIFYKNISISLLQKKTNSPGVIERGASGHIEPLSWAFYYLDYKTYSIKLNPSGNFFGIKRRRTFNSAFLKT